ncbi:hypothetical protein E3N88_38511 [Mikania micrantha]|uniref:Uncharacterized protein n=1 Tax=Mikania micrantha TaxID=192012 RepID=A0A5N6LU79_9ASTR|nr:hypothetical protein E3N88_38511 [Mikania micrantha]
MLAATMEEFRVMVTTTWIPKAVLYLQNPSRPRSVASWCEVQSGCVDDATSVDDAMMGGSMVRQQERRKDSSVSRGGDDGLMGAVKHSN